MKNLTQILFLTFVLLVSLPVNSIASFKQTQFTIVVVDEKDEPLSGIRVGVGFEKNLGWKTESSGQHGMTAADGRVTFSGKSNGHITYGGKKDGYYPCYYTFDFKDVGAFGWKPWNQELKIVMRKIENPVPMYIRDSINHTQSIAIPVVGEKVGFDLIDYDWVAPYGNGHHADFIFYFEKIYKNMREYSGQLQITFANKNDGIIKVPENLNEGSTYKLPRFAPEDKYANELLLETKQGPNLPWLKGFRENDNYIFRIRSKSDNGETVEAIYGKIVGPISFEPRIEPSEVYFKYFINPDGTQNLEHDPNKNLFRR